MSDMLIEYQIEVKTGGITTDGATNYEKSFKVFASDRDELCPNEKNLMDVQIENPEMENEISDDEVVFNIRCPIKFEFPT